MYRLMCCWCALPSQLRQFVSLDSVIGWPREPLNPPLAPNSRYCTPPCLRAGYKYKYVNHINMNRDIKNSSIINMFHLSLFRLVPNKRNATEIYSRLFALSSICIHYVETFQAGGLSLASASCFIIFNMTVGQLLVFITSRHSFNNSGSEDGGYGIPRK